MNKKFKRWIIAFFLIGIFTSPIVSLSEDSKDLIYDLKYDESRQVLTGKTTPHANVFLQNLAGSIVANDKGEFEIPIPKGTEESVIGMLDAEGDQSTNVLYNFKDNTVLNENDEEKTSDVTTEKTVEDSKKSEEKEMNSSSLSSEKISSEKESINADDSSETNSSSNKASINEISEELYVTPEEPELSLVWLWTLLVILIILGGGTGTYLWYKKKLEKEEQEKRRRSRKNRKRKKVTDATEDDEFENIFETKTVSVTEETSKKRKDNKTKKQSENSSSATTKKRRSSKNKKRK